MTGSITEEIKNRLDIFEVISSYIKLQKAGANYRAICPFHSEKKPSFFVSPGRQIWHCFGCQIGGDIFKFVMQIEGIEFVDALRLLAQRAGVELRKQEFQDPGWRTERQRLLEICELACKFYEKQLTGSATGRKAREYLLNRGISEASLQKWRVGYAPDAFRGLSDFLTSRGYKTDEMEKAGLAIKGERDAAGSSAIADRTSFWFGDRFRGRIMFPVFDANSQVVGFGGRVFEQSSQASKDLAKYVNTPATMLYDKSRILYGLDKAKVAIRKGNACILVEGYVDAIMCHQAGYENTVATSGTALTDYQLRIMKRFTENLLTAFDMDVAGNAATKRGIDLAIAQGFNVKVITMPQESDPADIIAADLSLWEKLIKEARGVVDFYFDIAFSKFEDQKQNGKTYRPQEKKEISSLLLPIIKKIPNRIEQSHWIQELSRKLGVKEEDLETELKKVRENGSVLYFEKENEMPVTVPKSRQELLEERVLSLLLKLPSALAFVDQELTEYLSGRTRQVLQCLKSNITPDAVSPAFAVYTPDAGEAILAVQPAELSDFLGYLTLKAEVEQDEHPDLDIESDIKLCLQEIKISGVKNKLDAISTEIKKAEQEGNLTRVQELLGEFRRIAGQLAES